MKKRKLFLIVLLAVLLGEALYAQRPPFPCPPNNPVCGGQPGLPIDSGVIVLFILGTAFALYKIQKR